MNGIRKKYKDTFQENLKKLIETKLEGGEVAAVEKPKKTGSGGGFDGCSQAELGADGGQEETGGYGQNRRRRRRQREGSHGADGE